MSGDIRLPYGDQLETILDLESNVELEDLLALTLMDPLRDFFSRPKKGIRGEMVALGFSLARGHGKHPLHESYCAKLAEVLELLHAGSLVVDDIQDGSLVRRGARSMHELYGVPVALNAGNWLYFWPLRKIDELDLTAEVRLRLYQECHATLLRAHFGQAIDVGAPVTSMEQERIPFVCMATLQLKTGALMSLAMKLGAILGGATTEELRAIDRFGHQFGVALQMFDDIGNLVSNKNPDKRFEDLKNARPGFVWSVAAEMMTKEEFSLFCSLVPRLPETERDVVGLLNEVRVIERARAKANIYLEVALKKLDSPPLSPDEATIARLRTLQQELTTAYE